MKKLYSRVLIGFLSGAVNGNLIVMIFSEPDNALCTEILLRRAGSLTGAMILQTLLSGLIGAVGMGGMSLYQETYLSLTWATLIHFGLIEAVFIPVAIFLGWMSPEITEIAKMSGMMLIAFLIIWLAMFFHYRREVRELNDMNSRNRK